LNVFIQAEYNQDYCRFLLETLSFAHLETTIRSLLHISPSQLVDIVFLDDEKDWVLVTNDEELKYACELSPSLLRLSVRGKGREVADPVAGHQEQCPVVLPAIPPRGGRGRGGMRGVRGRGTRGGIRVANPTLRIQMFDNRLACLAEKHATLSSKLPSASEEKAIILYSRLFVLESKIENIKQKKESFEALLLEQSTKREEGMEIEETATDALVEPFTGKFRGRGRRQGGCRGRRSKAEGAEVHPHPLFAKKFRGRQGGCRGRRWMGEGAEIHPVFKAFLEKKEELKASRQSGNREEMQEKRKALREARINWKDTKWSLKACPVNEGCGDSF